MSNPKYLGVMLILALSSFTTRVADSAEDPVVTPHPRALGSVRSTIEPQLDRLRDRQVTPGKH